MVFTLRSALTNLFRAICLIGTLIMTIFCIQEYVLDQDVTHIGYKKFHDEQGEVYPSITLCFRIPFRREKMLGLGGDVTPYLYKGFVSGQDYGNWNSSFSDIDYDNISTNFLDYLLNVEMYMLNGVYLKWIIENKIRMVHAHYKHYNVDYQNYSMVKPPEIYVSARLHNKKCFTMNIPFMENIRIYAVKMKIDKDIFPYGIRPKRNDFFITMHYPFQVIRSHVLSRVKWESSINETDCFKLTVSVGSMEVLKRRNKYKDPCNDNLKGHDNMALLRIIQDVGCSPIHWKIKSKLPSCKDRNQYADIQRLLRYAEETLPPCKSFERLITTAIGELCRQDDNALRIIFHFEDRLFKKITVLRAYGFQSLVGNAGKIVISNYNIRYH